MSGVALNCVALGGSALCRSGSEKRTPDGRPDPFALLIRHSEFFQFRLELNNECYQIKLKQCKWLKYLFQIITITMVVLFLSNLGWRFLPSFSILGSLVPDSYSSDLRVVGCRPYIAVAVCRAFYCPLWVSLLAKCPPTSTFALLW